MSKSEDNPDMRVLKTATCKTLSGKSTLTYQIGCTPESIIHLRISKNSGGGFFSEEWIAFDDVYQILKKRSEDSPIMSHFLTPLLKGKSANTSGFFLAVLKHLKLIQPLPKKQRLHELLDPRPFLDQVEKLMATGNMKAKGTTARKTPRKTASSSIKERAVAKKKSTTSSRKTSSAQR